MSDDKLSEFSEYFQINEPVKVSFTPVDDSEVPKNNAEIDGDMPPLFKLANELSQLDSSALRHLRNLGEQNQELVSFLEIQSRKIDLIMGHILAAEQDKEHSVYCDSYGGGGLRVTHQESWQPGDKLCCKLFLQHEAAAVFCYCEVISAEQAHNGTQYTLLFCAIRDHDRELLVRASLHAQTRQLKKRRTDNQESE